MLLGHQGFLKEFFKGKGLKMINKFKYVGVLSLALFTVISNQSPKALAWDGVITPEMERANAATLAGISAGSQERANLEVERYNREYLAAMASYNAGNTHTVFPTTAFLPRESQGGPLGITSALNIPPINAIPAIDEITQIRINQVNSIENIFARQDAMTALNRTLSLESLGNSHMADYNRRLQEARASGGTMPIWGFGNGTEMQVIGQHVLDTRQHDDLMRHNRWVCLTGGIGCETTNSVSGQSLALPDNIRSDLGTSFVDYESTIGSVENISSSMPALTSAFSSGSISSLGSSFSSGGSLFSGNCGGGSGWKTQ